MSSLQKKYIFGDSNVQKRMVSVVLLCLMSLSTTGISAEDQVAEEKVVCLALQIGHYRQVCLLAA